MSPEVSQTSEASPDRELIERLRTGLKSMADAEKAPQMQAYMKSEMPYLGVQTPLHRKLCKAEFQRHPIEDAATWRATALAAWREAEYREERYCVLNLLNFPAYRRFRTLEALPMYREFIVTGAWWDLVDNLAPYAFQTLLDSEPARMSRTLRQWAAGEDIWKRRAAIISQLKRKEATDTELLYDCIEPSIGDSEFFLRKGIGWALREYAKAEPQEVLRYVTERRGELSRLSQREAVRNVLTAEELRRFLAG